MKVSAAEPCYASGMAEPCQHDWWLVFSKALPSLQGLMQELHSGEVKRYGLALGACCA